MSNTKKSNVPVLFFSHSSRDAELLKFFVKAARMGFGVQGEDIRFSSEDSYGFEPGHDLGEQVQHEGTEADIFIAVLTPNSVSSDWVASELGARKGVKKPIYIVTANGLKADDVPGPYQGIVSKSCTLSGLESLFKKIAEEIGRTYDFESAREYLQDAESYSNAMAEARDDKPGDSVVNHTASAKAVFTSPTTGSTHKSPVEYEVKCTKLPTQPNSLWLCVEVDKKLWPKKPLNFNQSGDSIKSNVKEDGTSTYFFLVVVEVDPKGQEQIDNWFTDGKAHNENYPGMEDLTGSVIAYTQVIRKL